MLIVDAQVHIWGADTRDRPWPPGRAHQAQKPYPVTRDLVLAGMKEAGVDRAVLVPPSWEGDRNDLALEAARLYPDRFAVMGRLAIEKPESRALVAGWKKQPGMLGLRFTFHTELQKPWLTDGTADWLWPAAERAGIPVMIFPPGSIPAVDRIAERHPGLKLVIDHLAIGTAKKDDAAFAELPELCTLARRPNVAGKASALPCYSTEPYPFRGLHTHIRQVYDAFGPRRMFWATDRTRRACPWRQALTLFTGDPAWPAVLRQEEVPDVVGIRGSLRPVADRRERRAGQRPAEDMHQHRESVALVAAELPRAAERRDATLRPLEDITERLRRIGDRSAAAVDDPARRQRPVVQLVDLYSAGGDGRGRHVELEGWVALRGGRERQRIGSHDGLRGKRRHHRHAASS